MPPTHSVLHSSEADAHSASLGLLNDMIRTDSDGGTAGGDARITADLPPGRYRVAATTYENRAFGERQFAVGVEF